MKRITKGFLISKDCLISLRKFGGSIRMDSIDSLSSFGRSTSFGICPISLSAREFFIDSTASYATLFCRRIIFSSSKSSLNFSSVSLFLNFIKKLFSSGGVSFRFSLFAFFFGFSTGASFVFFIHPFSFAFSASNIF